jgi:hypothetical protein
MPHVYRHIRLDTNQPFYIGIGLDDIPKRAYETRSRRSEWWNRIVNKHGYEVHILFENVSIDFAKEKEKEFISLYGRINLGTGTLCNLTDGGDGSPNTIVSEETRQKQRERMLKNNPFKGKSHSLDTKALISKKAIERDQNGSRNPNYGKGDKIRGENNVMFGKTHSQEIKEKLSEINKNLYANGYINPSSKKVIDLETGIVYTSAKEAWDLHFKNKFTISYFHACLRGKRINKTNFSYYGEIQ